MTFIVMGLCEDCFKFTKIRSSFFFLSLINGKIDSSQLH